MNYFGFHADSSGKTWAFYEDKAGGRIRKVSASLVTCNYCGKSFIAEDRNIKRGYAKYCSQRCVGDSKQKFITLVCDVCGKEYKNKPNHLRCSKSGFRFCSKKCMAEAQSIKGDIKFLKMRPKHYGRSLTLYRRLAFEYYGKKCEVCGYDEQECALEVHHIDGDRKNNRIDNLIVLCSNHHAMVTYNIATLSDKREFNIAIKGEVAESG